MSMFKNQEKMLFGILLLAHFATHAVCSSDPATKIWFPRVDSDICKASNYHAQPCLCYIPSPYENCEKDYVCHESDHESARTNCQTYGFPDGFCVEGEVGNHGSHTCKKLACNTTKSFIIDDIRNSDIKNAKDLACHCHDDFENGRDQELQLAVLNYGKVIAKILQTLANGRCFMSPPGRK